ncbi:MAG UNVERIFIED_CONTAM: hypothetical protein LVR18_24170 [Planctomycetaceae bacterium]
MGSAGPWRWNCGMRGADVVINCRQSLERAEMVASDIRELGRLPRT